MTPARPRHLSTLIDKPISWEPRELLKRVRVGPPKKFQTRRRPRNDGEAARYGPAHASEPMPARPPDRHGTWWGLRTALECKDGLNCGICVTHRHRAGLWLPDSCDLFRSRGRVGKGILKTLAASAAAKTSTKGSLPHPATSCTKRVAELLLISCS